MTSITTPTTATSALGGNFQMIADKLQKDTGGKWAIEPNTNCIWAAIVRIHNYFCTPFTDLQDKHVTALDNVKHLRKEFDTLIEDLAKWKQANREFREWHAKNDQAEADHMSLDERLKKFGPEPADKGLSPWRAKEKLDDLISYAGGVQLAEEDAHEALCTRYEQVAGMFNTDQIYKHGVPEPKECDRSLHMQMMQYRYLHEGSLDTVY